MLNIYQHTNTKAIVITDSKYSLDYDDNPYYVVIDCNLTRRQAMNILEDMTSFEEVEVLWEK